MLGGSFMASSAAQLLEHREFVRSVAFAILRDAHDADDVAQEAMTRALARAPGPIESMRAWLAVVVRNLAFNLRRERSRRARRERVAAPGEVVPRVDLAARMETRQVVVAAVLALEEPYRSVVLAHYDAGESIASIAAERGMPEATVRSLLFRARERLRSKLEREYGGSRGLGLALAPLVGVPMGSKVGLAAAALVAVGLAVSVLTLNEGAGDAVQVARSTDVDAVVAPVVPAVGSEEAAVVAASDPIASVRDATSVVAPASADVDEILAGIVALRDELRVRLLRPDAAWARDPGDRLRALDGGVDRILERTRFGAVASDGPGEVLGIREGGSYFSFTRRDHAFRAETQLGLELGRLSSQAPGGDSWIVSLGDVDIERLSADPTAPPAELSAAKRESWATLLAPIDASDRDQTRAISQFMRDHGFDQNVSPDPGETFLVRSLAPRGHDVAAVVRPLTVDADGVTFAWRLLRVFRTAAPTVEPQLADPLAGIAPRALTDIERAATDAELLRAIASLRDRAKELALGIDDATLARIRSRFTSADVRVARVVTHPALAGLVTALGSDPGLELLRVDGRVHATVRPDVVFSEGSYRTHFGTGSFAKTLDLGSVSFDEFERFDGATLGLSPADAKVYEFLRDTDAEHADPDARSTEFFRRLRAIDARKAGFDVVPMVVGHTVLVRSMVDRDHDVLAAITSVEDDALGRLVAWRVLKTWKVRKNR